MTNWSKESLKNKINNIYKATVAEDDITTYPKYVYAIPTFIPPDSEGNTTLWHPSGKPKISPDNVDNFISEILEDNNLTEEDWNLLTTELLEGLKTEKIELSKTDYSNYVPENSLDYYKKWLMCTGGDIVVPNTVSTIYIATRGALDAKYFAFGASLIKHWYHQKVYFNIKGILFGPKIKDDLRMDRDFICFDTIHCLRSLDLANMNNYFLFPKTPKYVIDLPDNYYYRNNPKAVYCPSGKLCLTNAEQIFAKNICTFSRGTNTLISNLKVSGDMRTLDRYTYQSVPNLEAIVVGYFYVGYGAIINNPKLTDIFIIQKCPNYTGLRSIYEEDIDGTYNVIPYKATDLSRVVLKFHVMPFHKNSYDNNLYWIEYLQLWANKYYRPEGSEEDVDITNYYDADIQKWIELFLKSPFIKDYVTRYIKKGVADNSITYNGEFDSILKLDDKPVYTSIDNKLDYLQSLLNWNKLLDIGITDPTFKGLANYLDTVEIPLEKDFEETSPIKQWAVQYSALLQDYYSDSEDGMWDLIIPTGDSPIWNNTTKTWEIFNTLSSNALGNHTHINSIYIPANITSIPNNLIMYTRNIKSIVVDPNNPVYSSKVPTLNENNIYVPGIEEANLVWVKDTLALDYRNCIITCTTVIPNGINKLNHEKSLAYVDTYDENGDLSRDFLIPTTCKNITIQRYSNIDYCKYSDTPTTTMTFDSYSNLFNVVFNDGSNFNNRNVNFFPSATKIFYWDNGNKYSYSEVHGNVLADSTDDIFGITWKVPDNITTLNSLIIAGDVKTIYLNNVSTLKSLSIGAPTTQNVIVGDVDKIYLTYIGDNSSITKRSHIDGKIEFKDVTLLLSVYNTSGSSSLAVRFGGRIYFRNYHGDTTSYTIISGNNIEKLVLKEEDFPITDSTNNIKSYALQAGTFISKKGIKTIIFPPQLTSIGVKALADCGVESTISNTFYYDEYCTQIYLGCVFDFSNIINGTNITITNYTSINQTHSAFHNTAPSTNPKTSKGKNVILIPDITSPNNSIDTIEYTEECLEQWVGEESELETASSLQLWWFIFRNSALWKYENDLLSFYLNEPSNFNVKYHVYDKLYLYWNDYNMTHYTVTFMTLRQYQTLVDSTYTSYNYD